MGLIKANHFDQLYSRNGSNQVIFVYSHWQVNEYIYDVIVSVDNIAC